VSRRRDGRSAPRQELRVFFRAGRGMQIVPVQSMETTTARVLVADDQADVLEALRWLLVGEGYEAELVASTDLVMERVQVGAFDLLLMDLNYTRDTTSGREGLDLILRVRAVDPLIPIVVMTGWGSIDTAVDAMRRGASSFVQKPWDDSTLRDIVEREIGAGRAARRQDRKQQRELDEARLIQRALLPAALPQVHGLRLAAVWQPMDGVGGDCFDVTVSGSAVGVMIADVAGKGMPAALLMSNLQAAVRAFAQDGAAPCALATSVNRLLCRHMVSGRFVTFCFARIDAAHGCVAYVNAGHNPPLVIRAGGAVERLTEGGTVLGVFPDATFVQAQIGVSPGDRLLFYTDGISEARNTDGEEFGEQRIAAAAIAGRTLSAEDLKARVAAEVQAFTGGAFDDDATIIVAALVQED
jgi:sigma-B regulation protein RsbU (phosphoserine phosphatase)